MTDVLKIGVAGVGAIGKNHARICAALDGAQLAAIYDTDMARAQELAALYGSRAVSTLEEFAALVDAATVAVPTVAHRQVAGYLLEQGKHVLVEKPISDQLSEAQELVALAASRNLVLQVGHIERFNPVMKQLEERIELPRFIEATRLSPFPHRSTDIGVVLDLMIHDLEIILHLVKSPLVQVDAVGTPVLTRREDIANARLRFANGCVANVTASRISDKKMRKIQVFHSEGYISLDYQEQSGHIYTKNGLAIQREEVQVEKDEPLKLELAAFRECARRGAQPVVSGQQGADALKLAIQITEEIERNNLAAPGGMKKIFIIAGEISGDAHGAGLIRAIHDIQSDIRFLGMGGPRMRAAGGDGVEDWVEDAAVVGLWEVLKMYGWFKARFDRALEVMAVEKPDAVILIDYPGFNLRIAKALRKAGFPAKILYYISPQVWAWKRGRIKTMAKVLDLMICIFPFEKELYEKSGLRTVFAGHPMMDRARTLARQEPREGDLVGFLPGSRRNEIKRIFPTLLQAAALIRRDSPAVRFAISAANERLAAEMRALAAESPLPEAREWIELGSAQDLMQRAGVGVVASGTATMEAACFGLPYVLVYRVNPLTYAVGKAVIRVKYLGMVNILAGREVVHELVQGRMTPQNIAAEILSLLQDPGRRAALSTDLQTVAAKLGEGNAYQRAAAAVTQELFV